MSAALESQVQKGLRISTQRLQDASTKLLAAVGRADLTNPTQLERIQRLQKKLNLLQQDIYRETAELDEHLRRLENTEGNKEYRGFVSTQLTVPSNEMYDLGEEFPKMPLASGGAGGGASAAAGRGTVATELSKKRTRRNRGNRNGRRPKN